jgi:Homeodomain-like domain
MSDTGPGRRLTAAEEQQAAEMFAAGKSEREVADAVGCSASTAHRLRERLAREAAPAAPAATVPAGPDTPEAPVAPEPAAPAEAATEPPGLEMTGVLLPSEDEIAALRKERGEVAAAVATYEERAQESRTAIVQLEADRREVLAAGHDAAPLRPRLRDAADDLKDSEEAAALARGYLLELDGRLAAIEGRQAFGRMRGELAREVEISDVVCASTGNLQRAAVLAIKAAAEKFVQAVADEQAAISRRADLAAAVTAAAVHLGEPVPEVPAAVPTALWIHPDAANAGGALALHKAINRAREGNVQATAVHLAEAFGWVPPDPAQVAAERERLLAMQAQQASPAVEPHQPWTRPDTATVALDRDGKEVPPWMVRPPHPSDGYPGSPAAAPAGWLGGQPWPG